MSGSESQQLRTILVDDERAARGLLARRLEAFAQVRVIAEAEDGVAAIEVINREKPDLVFLDVQMPEVTGFDVLPYLNHQPMIVFCSAHDQYALQAFEEQALDYLLKPVEHDRLSRCLERVVQQKRVWSLTGLLGSMEKIVCRHGDGFQVVWLRDVRMLHKDGRYTSVTTLDGRVFLTDLTIDHLEQKLSSGGLFRVNRSAIVRREVIQRMRLKPSGSGELLLDDGSVVALAKQRIRGFREWFGW